MKNIEKQRLEYKSVSKIRSGDKGFRDLASTCVAFANAQGGELYIGYEDKTCAPPANQLITDDEVNNTTSRLRSLCFNVSLQHSDILTHENGSQYFIIKVSPSVQSIATTSDGKVCIRVADKCEVVRSEDMQRLMEEKGSYRWELVKSKYRIDDIALSNLSKLASEIRASKRASEHIKQLDDREIAEYYSLVDGESLTNIGVLWLGSPKQRAALCYPLTVQYIVYDGLEQKIRKVEWRDNLLNPKDLLLDIENKAVELTYSYEFPNGLFRKQIRQYHPKLLRELLVNAIAHKSYCISNDVMIKVYPDRLEISNPGGLPLGITKDNILHSKYRRNPKLIELLSVLEMMEGEGSGYDLIYEINAMAAKKQPVIESSYEEVNVIQEAAIVDREILPLLDYVLQNYQLKQKNYIAFGAIALQKKVSSTELSRILQLSEEDRLRSYTTTLLKQELVIQRGTKKGAHFIVNPKLIDSAKANIKTTLKTVEPHILKALIMEDLRVHPNSSLADIAYRIADADIKDIRKIIYSAALSGEIKPIGPKSTRKYSLP